MYNYIAKFTYDGKSYECVFQNEMLFNKETEEEILANQASEAANVYIDNNHLRKNNVFISNLCLLSSGGNLIWKK